MLRFLLKNITLTTNIWLQKYFDTLQVIWWLFVVCYGGWNKKFLWWGGRQKVPSDSSSQSQGCPTGNIHRRGVKEGIWAAPSERAEWVMYMFSCISLSRQQLCTCTMLTGHFSAVMVGRRERRRDDLLSLCHLGEWGWAEEEKPASNLCSTLFFLWFGKFWPSDMCTCTAWGKGRSPTTTTVVLSSPDVGWQVYGEQTLQQVAACSLQMCGLAEALFCCTAGRGERVYAQPLASVVCTDDFWLSSHSLQTSLCALLGVWYPGLLLTASPWLNSREKWPNPARVTHQWHRTATAHCKFLSWPQELSKALFCIHIICMKSLFCVILCASQ